MDLLSELKAIEAEVVKTDNFELAVEVAEALAFVRLLEDRVSLWREAAKRARLVSFIAELDLEGRERLRNFIWGHVK